MRLVERVLDGLLVGLVVGGDAPADLLHGELAVVDRLAGVEHAPDEADAERRLATGRSGTGPRRIEQRGVHVEDRAVRVDVRPREIGRASCRERV